MRGSQEFSVIQESTHTVTIVAHFAVDVCQRFYAQVTDGGVVERKIIVVGYIHMNRTAYDVHQLSCLFGQLRQKRVDNATVSAIDDRRM